MTNDRIGGFPSQQLSFSRKNKKWRKQCVDFGDDHSLLHYNLTRKSVRSMKINYDLLNGIVYMDEMKKITNPFSIDASFIPDHIQHYPVINAKLKVLEGEESRRLFDYRVVITNPSAISEAENIKNELVNTKLQQLVSNTAQSEEEFQEEIQKLSDYFTYEYQDKREVRANRLLNHYSLEQDFQNQFNKGFKDAYTVGEELYQCDIVGGEPVLEKLNPAEVRILRSGTSDRIEDADMIIIEQYWNPGRVIDTYWDQLSKKDVEKLENGTYANDGNYYDSMGNIDARKYNAIPWLTKTEAGDAIIDANSLFTDNYGLSLLPYDHNGNVRVLRVYWKSRRKIKKVKSYDQETGEELFDFYPETYVIDQTKGEEEETFWVNEAWEGVKIAEDIYVNMRPRPIQYSRLSNPSICHFGIIGSLYTSNGQEPYSVVDIMKPYAYLYDVIHDRLNKVLAKNVGKVIRLDFAKVPKGWDADKWLYYINVNGIAVENSFKEGDTGAATGQIAGGLNNASSGVIDASLGNEIISYTGLLDWIDNHCGNLIGMTPQRIGQIANRETVGGVERATLQSSHSTEWLFFTHENVKKRVLECFLETAKIALKGRKKKFEYILDDGSKQIEDLDGDEFAECDYGLVLDNSEGVQKLNQQLDVLAQAGLQNGMSFSAIMGMYITKSSAEKRRLIENDERRRQEMQQQQQQQQMQMQQQQIQANIQIAQENREMQYQMHKEKLEAEILIAQINSRAEEQRFAMMQEDEGLTERQEIEYKKEQLELDNEQFNKKLAFDAKKLAEDSRLKELQIKESNKNKTK